MHVLTWLNRLLLEMRRRNVLRVALAYAVTAWLVVQVAATVFPAFGFPDWALPLVIVLAALGFPLSLVLAWAFELTPEGVRREPVPDGELATGPSSAGETGGGGWPGDLPPEPTPFIGRSQEVSQLRSLLGEGGCRLVTLTGPGGIGKSRLALHLAHSLRPSFPGGAHFIPLGDVAAARFLSWAIAEHLGLGAVGGGDPRQHILRFVRDKQLLLVLDGFEHLVDGSTLVAELLEHAPALRVLVTSRERLNLHAETVFSLTGLEVGTGDRPGDAVELFVRGAMRSDPRVACDDLAEVTRICQAVEGVPLALELASAWAGALSFREIAEQIERNRDFLHAGARDYPERHRSLRAAFDWSWHLLSDEDRTAFRRLAIFRGGFRREAAEQIAGTGLSTLSSLIDKSLVRRTRLGTYEVPEMLRQYAEERLRERPQEHERMRAQHGEYYTELLAGAERRLQGPEQRTALRECDAERANLRLAWQWAVEQRRTDVLDRAAEALFRLFTVRGWAREGSEAFAAAVAALRPSGAAPDRLTAKLMIREASLRVVLGENERARVLLEEALAAARAAGERSEEARALVRLGVAALHLGDREAAQRQISEGLASYREQGDEVGIASATSHLGSLAYLAERYDEAQELWFASLALYRAHGRLDDVGRVLKNLGGVAAARSQYTDAKRFILEGLAIDRELENRLGVVYSLQNLGYTCLQAGEYPEAERHLQEGLEASRTLGFRRLEGTLLDTLGSVHLAQGRLGDAERRFGQALEVFAGIDETPQVLEVLVGVGALLARLSAREQAVHLLGLVLAHPLAVVVTRSRAEAVLRSLGEPPPAAGASHDPDELGRVVSAILERRSALAAASPGLLATPSDPR